MKTTKMIATMMTLSMLAAAFAGCLGGDEEEGTNCVDQDDPDKTTVNIGFLNPITGPLESNAPVFTWSACEAANDLGEMYPDYNFVLVEQDSGCDGTIAATAAQTLVDSGVYAVVGAACTGASKGANAILSAANIPMISYASTNPGLSSDADYPLFYRVIPSDGIQGPAGADMMVDAGVTNGSLAIFHMTNDYGAGLGTAVQAAWEDAGHDLCSLGMYGYEESNTDFSDIAAQMAAASDCTAVYLSSYIKDAALILEALDDAGWTGHVFGGDGPAGEGIYDELADDTLATGMVTTSPRAASTYGDFDARYDAGAPEGGIKIYDLTTYDATMMIGKAAVANPDDAVVGVEAIGVNYEGASGLLNFLDNGDVSGTGYDICSYDGTALTVTCDKYWTAEGGVQTTA